VNRDSRTPTSIAKDALDELANAWAALHEGAPISTYWDGFNEMGRDASLDADVLAQRYNELTASTPDDESLSIGHDCQIAIATAYCIQAIRSEKSGLLHKAWTFAVDAAHWRAMVRAAHAAVLGQGATISQRASKAANARHAAHHQAKADALEWWKENREKYGNKDDAAEAYAGQVAKYSFDTVRDWLREPRKPGSPKKRKK
jgi:hypothetical protein